MIYLLRHGETIWNRDGRNQGRCDSPLTLRGIELAYGYARALRRSLEDYASVSIHASPLPRAWQTASIVSEHLGIEPATLCHSPLLQEMDCGEWEGLTRAEIEARDGARYAAYREDVWTRSPPGGETRSQVYDRARCWLAMDRSEEVTIVVAHGVVSRVMRGAYLGLSPAGTLELDSHQHGRFYRLDGGLAEAVQVPMPARSGA